MSLLEVQTPDVSDLRGVNVVECDMLVLGSVCLNVGCIPSKALLHTALVIDDGKALESQGIEVRRTEVDLDKLRDFKLCFVKNLTGGRAGMAKAARRSSASSRRSSRPVRSR